MNSGRGGGRGRPLSQCGAEGAALLSNFVCAFVEFQFGHLMKKW